MASEYDGRGISRIELLIKTRKVSKNNSLRIEPWKAPRSRPDKALSETFRVWDESLFDWRADDGVLMLLVGESTTGGGLRGLSC